MINKLTSVQIGSIVSARDGQPYVQMQMSDGETIVTQLRVQMTPYEARQHAYTVLEAADAAESDHFIFNFLKEKIGVAAEQAAPVLAEFREYREAMSKKGKQ